MVRSQVVIGIIFIVLGIPLTLTIIGAIYGIPMFLIGLFLIIFRKSESEIEQIRKPKGGNK